MKQIAVFGSSGMLGAYVSSHFKSIGYSVTELSRKHVITDNDKLHDLLNGYPPGLIVNCVGVIKPQIAVQGPAETIRVNSLFPHLLSKIGKETGHKVIHITTDCVYSGQTGNYTEASKHDELDLYGRSKSLGEPSDCTVIRTSIIGEEKTHKRSLIEWAKSQSGKQVKGFTNHSWNGVTCLELAKIIEQVEEKNMFWDGVRNVFSPTAVNKFELLSLIDKAFKLNLEIQSFQPAESCFRSLATEYPEVVGALDIPELEQQLIDLSKYTWGE